MTKKSDAPAIRFKGFSDAWEQRKAIDIADYSKGNGYSKGDLTDSGTPIILYGRLYTKYQFAISEVDTFAVPRNGAVYSQGNEVIVPASGETAEDIARASAVEKSGVLLGGDLNILRPFDFINPLFLALAISNGEPQKELAKKAQGKSVVHIHNTDIQEVTIAYPSRTEQDRIVSVFRQLDNLITLHQRKLDKLINVKKSMLEKMFPKQGSTVPKVRFSGFTEDWEQRKLGELYQKNTEKNEDLIGYDKTISIATMTYKGEGNGASDNSLRAYKVLRTGDLAFEGHTNKEFRYGRFVANDIGIGIMSPRFSTLRPKNDMPIIFWKYYIHYEPVMKSVLVNSTKAGTMMNELVISEFMTQPIFIPSYEEQKKIGAYLDQIDQLITLHQR